MNFYAFFVIDPFLPTIHQPALKLKHNIKNNIENNIKNGWYQSGVKMLAADTCCSPAHPTDLSGLDLWNLEALK